MQVSNIKEQVIIEIVRSSGLVDFAVGKVHRLSLITSQHYVLVWGFANKTHPHAPVKIFSSVFGIAWITIYPTCSREK